jgi:hypothetical protein
MLIVRSRKVFVGLFVGVALLVIGSLMFSPLKAHKCEDATQTDKENCPSYNVVLVSVWKIGELLQDSTFITALATVFIAGFTATLWRSNEKMWKLTRRSVEIAERQLFAANNPIVTIADLELRNPDEILDKPHINWGIRNSGPGLAIVHTIITRTQVKMPQGTARSNKRVDWGGAVESKDTVPDIKLTTPSIQRRIDEIRGGAATLHLQIQLNGQNIFKDRFSVWFSFVFDHKANTFRRVAEVADDHPQKDTETQE